MKANSGAGTNIINWEKFPTLQLDENMIEPAAIKSAWPKHIYSCLLAWVKK